MYAIRTPLLGVPPPRGARGPVPPRAARRPGLAPACAALPGAAPGDNRGPFFFFPVSKHLLRALPALSADAAHAISAAEPVRCRAARDPAFGERAAAAVREVLALGLQADALAHLLVAAPELLVALERRRAGGRRAALESLRARCARHGLCRGGERGWLTALRSDRLHLLLLLNASADDGDDAGGLQLRLLAARALFRAHGAASPIVAPPCTLLLSLFPPTGAGNFAWSQVATGAAADLAPLAALGLGRNAAAVAATLRRLAARAARAGWKPGALACAIARKLGEDPAAFAFGVGRLDRLLARERPDRRRTPRDAAAAFLEDFFRPGATRALREAWEAERAARRAAAEPPVGNISAGSPAGTRAVGVGEAAAGGDGAAGDGAAGL
jgi:hypothetical protein